MKRPATSVSPGREAAASILAAVERGRRLDVAFEEAAPRLTDRDRGWVQELTYGVTRWRGRLDHLLDLHLNQGIGSVDLPIRILLRMGAYQLLAMDGVPAYAAVSQTVEQARSRKGRALAGLINAVLRALGRAGGGVERFPSFEGDPLAHLSTWGSHPRWLLERWISRFGVEETRALTEANNRIPFLHLRPLGLPLEEARTRLAERGLEAHPDVPGSGTLQLPKGTDPLPALQALPALIQDPAAGMVVGWVGEVSGTRVADLCAAPGGKGLALAALGARVAAGDPSPTRIRRMAESLARVDLPVGLVVARGEDPPFRPHPVVLVDAPCSGTGTLARHPDARWRLRPGTLEELQALQDRILDGAARITAPGGLLVYATCSLEREENQSRVEAFLERHPEFIVEGAKVEVPEEVREGFFLEILPWRTGTDGAFASRLRRRPPGG